MNIQKKRVINNKIVCAKCSKPLSVGPIMLYENIGTICGRCSMPDELGNGIHVTIYEEMANRFNFPCCYHMNGCTFMGMFNGLKEHEEICGKMQIKCPIGQMCSFVLDKTVKHWKDRHADMILSKTMFYTYVKQETFRIYFLTETNLLIHLRPVEDDLHLSVGFIGATSKEYRSFSVILISFDGKQSVAYENQPFRKCLTQKPNDLFVCIKKETLESLTVDKTNLFLRFVISLVLNEEHGSKTCQICAKKLEAEVKLCHNGHVSCEKCAISSFECTLCKEKLVSPQKPTFYVNLNDQITYDCPLREKSKCNFHGPVKTTLMHFLNVHKDAYKTGTKETITLIKDQLVTNYIYCYGRLFIFNGDYKARHISINTVVFTDLSDKKYQFVVELKNDKSNFLFTEDVIPINQVKDKTESSLDLTEFMLKPFIEKDSITFSFSLLCS